MLPRHGGIAEQELSYSGTGLNGSGRFLLF